MNSTLIKAQDFLARYAGIDPTARSRFRTRAEAESFEGLKVIQSMRGSAGRRGTACFFLREQAERFLERKRRELTETPAPVAQAYDQRARVQYLLDHGQAVAAAAIARKRPRHSARHATRG